MRQRLPLERDDEAPGRPRPARLRERAEPRAAQLEAGPGRAEADLRQPAPGPGRPGQGPSEGSGEKLERAFAHMLTTGGMRRTHLRGHENIRKRLLVHAAGFNLGLLMRQPVRLRHAEKPAGEKCVHASNRSPRDRLSRPFSGQNRTFRPPGARAGPGYHSKRGTGPAGATIRRHFAEIIFRGPHARFCHGLLAALGMSRPRQRSRITIHMGGTSSVTNELF